jgi:diadenosine tetraphosphate (Ap4A) HIT family hydrolase
MEGYLMLIPKRHVLGMASLNKNEKLHFFNILNTIRPIIADTFGTMPICQEHGSVNEGRFSNSIVHAHLHIAPINLTKTSHERMIGEHDMRWVDAMNEFQNYDGKNYWLYIDEANRQFMSSMARPLNPPRQAFRKIVADQLDMGDKWNWRESENAFMDNISKTVTKLGRKLKNLKPLAENLTQCKFAM